LVRLLKESLKPYSLRIASLEGGTAKNAIPTEASAVVFLAEASVAAFTKQVQDFEATVQSELKATEPNLTVQLQAVQSPSQVMDQAFQNILIDAVYGTPQGVLRMSDTVPDLVETSTNLGITSAQDGQLQISCFPRSSVGSELDDAAQMIISVWELAGYPAEISNRFAAWTPNPDSAILAQMKSVYKSLFGVDAQTTAVHAGLECGAIGGIYPDMDMISIGPTLENVHAPQERLYIPSVQKVMDLLTATLQQMPVAQASWQTYTNPAGFSIQYPGTWTQQHLPDPGDGTIHADKLQGTEGYVELQWGVGFGGACPQGYTTVKVAHGELPACYTKNADGTETWTQINKQLSSTTGFSGNAATNNADPASHDLVLQVLSTLDFSATQ
jgi:hypothetical protein